ncbi:hypothetical protein GH714_033338 [Hevea brasiliensis]|uniref:C2H2-type domain-containing protein n=1 Tax=Hevea brasiliensis TaxID=3981 RepID=A0A6A6M511_HEVBR|nr:hypothetical protein GH714_033338 [Hevea brasiliensis]
MGTPQFPDLGKHCTKEDCKQIDFLPFTCDRCRQVPILSLSRLFISDGFWYFVWSTEAILHSCPKADGKDVTVVICPLCAKGVRLNPDEDPNISWETHVNTECDPSNYEKVTKKRKCPVRGCREVLTFSNTIKCRDCTIDHCLKHRFGPDHDCPGPKKIELQLFGPQLKRVAKLSTEISQAWQTAKNTAGPSSSSGGDAIGLEEECPQCGARFSSVTVLVEHVQKVHERGGNQSRVLKLPVDVCPKCSKGFRDPVALVEHVERDHGGTSKA